VDSLEFCSALSIPHKMTIIAARYVHKNIREEWSRRVELNELSDFKFERALKLLKVLAVEVQRDR